MEHRLFSRNSLENFPSDLHTFNDNDNSSSYSHTNHRFLGVVFGNTDIRFERYHTNMENDEEIRN